MNANFRFISKLSPRYFTEFLQIISSEPKNTRGDVGTSFVVINISCDFKGISDNLLKRHQSSILASLVLT